MKLLILGAGEYGQLVKEMARNQYSIIDFLDDSSDKAIGSLADYEKLVDEYKNAVVAVGNNEVRNEWITKLEEAGYNLPIILSDKAFVSPSSVIEPGCIIEPMVVIQTNSHICKGSIISAGSVINHNSTIKEGCHIDCNAVVGADAVVPPLTHLNYGQVITRVSKPENWEFSE